MGMRQRIALGLVVMGLTTLVVAAEEPKKADAKASPSFKDDIKPILAANCTSCHNPKKAKGRVELESLAGVMRTIKAGQADQSRLVKSLTGKGAKQMPPKSSIDAKEIDLIKAWIADGAKDN